jgi:mycoredoxin
MPRNAKTRLGGQFMQPDIRIYGVEECEDTRRARQHLNALGVPYTYINLDKDEDADRKVREWNGGRRLTPTIIIARNGRTTRLVEPGNDAVDAAIQGEEFGSVA